MGKGRIITTLRRRREIEHEIRQLLELKSQDDIFSRVDKIAQEGDEVLPILIANLETTNPHFRGALGLVASRLPRDISAPAFRAAATDESLSDQARLTAVMILERFLDEEYDSSTLAGLKDPRDVALQSLQEVLEASREDRNILVEYARSFQEQPVEVGMMVLAALEHLPPDDRVELLRIFAQDDRPAIRDQALATLGKIRSAAARRSILILRPNISPSFRPILDRALRKLALAGIPEDPLPPPDPRWRALVSPVDGQGNQSIWFLRQEEGGHHCQFLSVLISDRIGLKDSFGGDEVFGQRFPPLKKIGSLHAVPLRDSALNLNLLEADFDYGRRLVLEGLKANFNRTVPIPLEYRLLNDHLWGYAWQDTLSPLRLPKVSRDDVTTLLPRTPQLLELTDFTTWFIQSAAIYEYAERLRKIAIRGISTFPRLWIEELAEQHFARREIREIYSRRLRTMSEWLYRGGQKESARLSLAAARGIHRVMPAEHPLLLRLIQIGLGIAVSSLSQGLDLRKSLHSENGLS